MRLMKNFLGTTKFGGAPKALGEHSSEPSPCLQIFYLCRSSHRYVAYIKHLHRLQFNTFLHQYIVQIWQSSKYAKAAKNIFFTNSASYIGWFWLRGKHTSVNNKNGEEAWKRS